MESAAKELQQALRRNSKLVHRIQGAVESVQAIGWREATKVKLIKELESDTNVCEIRVMGKGGCRLFSFWDDRLDGARHVFITKIEKKGNLLSHRRVQELIRSTAARRTRWLKAGGLEP